ncbi:MAG TPA: hypothetical protein VG347_08150 [Verrucomicrobiae bacterium]|nr:hypothetical protein [Verrucomicrobiae bacterium]
MKTNLRLGAVVAALFLVIVAGCATARVDWNARVGTFTFDQAVTELGPPDKQAKLSDGDTVAEWVTRHYANNSVMVGSGFGYGPGGVGYVQNIGPNTYESSLRLTFTTNNVLAAWKRN